MSLERAKEREAAELARQQRKEAAAARRANKVATRSTRQRRTETQAECDLAQELLEYHAATEDL